MNHKFKLYTLTIIWGLMDIELTKVVVALRII